MSTIFNTTQNPETLYTSPPLDDPEANEFLQKKIRRLVEKAELAGAEAG
jgi:hypothetical protein